MENGRRVFPGRQPESDVSGKIMRTLGHGEIPRRRVRALAQTLAGCLLVLVFCGVGLADRAVDTITLVDGTTLRGRISSATAEGVVVQPQGNPEDKKLSMDEIASIRFGGEPAPLGAIRDQIKAGEWEAAKQSLGRLKESPDDPMIKGEIEFYRAYLPALEALRNGSGHKEAASKLYNFTQQRKQQSHHYPEAVRTLGQLALHLRSYDVARKQFLELQSLSSPIYRLWGVLGEAEALEYQGNEKFAAAAAVLSKGESVPGSSPQLERLRTIAVARRWGLQGVIGKSEDAIAALEKLIQAGDSKDAPLFAELYNARGMAHQAAGHDEDALCDFLMVDLIYSSERDAHAKALAQITMLFQKVSQPERSQDARKRLLTAYPGNYWAQKLGAE